MAASIGGPERRIVLVGKTGNGKSATGNTILGSNIYELRSSANSTTNSCQKEETLWNGRKIVVVDTPGFLDTGRPERENVAAVSKCVRFCHPGPHVILWVVDPWCSSQESEDMARLIKEVFGWKGNNYMIILFTFKDLLKGTPLQNFSYFQEKEKYIAECGNRYLAFNNQAKGEKREAQRVELMKMIDELVQKNGGAPCYMEEMMKKDEEEFKGKKSPWCSIV